MAAAASRDLLLPRRPPGMGAGALLALLVHAGLIVALAFSVRWRASEPEGVQAELWAAVPQIAAPPPAAAPAPPPPRPQPVARPEPKPAPAALPDAQIAVEKAKREKTQQEKLEREKEAREKAEKAEKAATAEKAERARREEDRLAAQREANLKRAMGLAGATGAPTSTGTAAQTSGPSASYAGRIKARIKPNIVFTDSIDGNPLATVEVRLAPDGTIVGRRLLKSSGVKAWDEAVLRAIDKTEVLPRDTDGRVPASFEIDFRVRE